MVSERESSSEVLMGPTKEISFSFAFKKSLRPQEAPFGIEQMLYSATRTGDVTTLDYVALAFDYVPRIYWAFESQRQLQVLRHFIDLVILDWNPLPASQDWHLLLGWCGGLRAQPLAVRRPQIRVISTVIEPSRLRRSIRNPIPFSLFNRPSFNMHLATLNAVLEFAALAVGEARWLEFNAALQQLLRVCQDQPGFWNGAVDGPIRSMQVVDQILQGHQLA